MCGRMNFFSTFDKMMGNEARVEPEHETVENIGARIIQLKRSSRVLVR
jgi:hypothetical protein